MSTYSRDKRDIYYRLAKARGYRSRSAFKLLQLNAALSIFSSATRRVVDLCASPGGWTQVARQLAPRGRVVAVDLYPMDVTALSAPDADDVTFIRGDITRESTAAAIVSALHNELADVVLCDGAPDVIGADDVDEYMQHQLVLAALQIAVAVIADGGAFVFKCFRGANAHRIIRKSRTLFHDVILCKPKASRISSFEVFVVARGYRAHRHIDWTRPLSIEADDDDGGGGAVSYLLCADDSHLDSDATYPLSFVPNADARNGDSYRRLNAVAAPIAPPYSAAALRSKHDGVR